MCDWISSIFFSSVDCHAVVGSCLESKLIPCQDMFTDLQHAAWHENRMEIGWFNWGLENERKNRLMAWYVNVHMSNDGVGPLDRRGLEEVH